MSQELLPSFAAIEETRQAGKVDHLLIDVLVITLCAVLAHAEIRHNYSDPRRKESRKGRRKYRATKALCSVCPSKQKCCPKANTRYIAREEHEDARDFARLAAKSDFNPKAQANRKKVEMVLSRFSSSLFRAMFAMKEIENGKDRRGAVFPCQLVVVGKERAPAERDS